MALPNRQNQLGWLLFVSAGYRPVTWSRPASKHSEMYLFGGGKAERPPEVVLVPPLLERDHRSRSRLTKSSYDYHFCKPQLKWLFLDYIWPGATGLLRFSPAEDRRVSVKARFGVPHQSGPLSGQASGAPRC